MYYDGSGVLRYRSQGSIGARATTKLKKGQTPDDILSIILSKLKAQQAPQRANASSAFVMDAQEPVPVPAEDPKRAAAAVPGKWQRAQPEDFSPSKHWSGYEREQWASDTAGSAYGLVR